MHISFEVNEIYFWLDFQTKFGCHLFYLYNLHNLGYFHIKNHAYILWGKCNVVFVYSREVWLPQHSPPLPHHHHHLNHHHKKSNLVNSRFNWHFVYFNLTKFQTYILWGKWCVNLGLFVLVLGSITSFSEQLTKFFLLSMLLWFHSETQTFWEKWVNKIYDWLLDSQSNEGCQIIGFYFVQRVLADYYQLYLILVSLPNVMHFSEISF